MKLHFYNSLALAGLLAVPQLTLATTFFTETFNNGSTVNGPSVPGGTPTASFTSYDIASGKTATAATNYPGWLKLTLNAATGAGILEAQALFATNPVSLVMAGDYIDAQVVFTNAGNILSPSTKALLCLGLYSSGGSAPVPGGLANAGLNTTTYPSGYAAGWQGYVGQIASNGTCRIVTRPVQTGATSSRCQDLIGNGVSGGTTYGDPGGTALATGPTQPINLVNNAQYTLSLRILLNSDNTLTISNALFSGVGTGGTLLYSQMTANAPNSTSAFDGLAIGVYQSSTASANPNMSITSITITGQSTVVTQPPVINTQPAAISVPTNSLAFFSVNATGFNLSYQWHRYGTNLVDGGNISGAKSDTLIICPVSAADVASGANGYSVTITGAGGYSTNSTTVALSLRTANNLTWLGNSMTWDLATTANWTGGNGMFNQGDAVTFDDSNPSAYLQVQLTGNYLSPSTITVSANNAFTGYEFDGSSGALAGPTKLNYIGASPLTIDNANTYTGGTLISNSLAVLTLKDQRGLGSGLVTLAQGKLQLVNSGSGGGLSGDIEVKGDFTIEYDANSSYGAVFSGDLSGTPGKTLTFARGTTPTPASSRVRLTGTNTVYDANLNLSDPTVVLALYQNSGFQTYNGLISGPGSLIQRANGTTVLAGANTYTGGTTPTTGTIGFGSNTSTDGSGNVTAGPIGTGPLLLAPEAPSATGSGTVLAWGGPRTVANALQYPSATNNLTLIIGGTNALTLSGPIPLNGTDGLGTYTNRTFQVANTALTTLSGVIAGTGFGLTKTGNGVLALTATETYTGPTTVSAGTLQVNGRLDAGAVTVSSNATLAGTGTIGGPVTVAVGGILAPGTTGTGTLTVNNSLSLAGNLQVGVNKAASPTSGKVVVSGTLSNTGTGSVIVTNLGGTLNPGDTFTLFSKPLANGNALTVSGGGMNWANNLAVDGTIQVVGPLNTYAPVFSAPTAGTNISVYPGTQLSIANTATDADVPAQTLAYSLLNGPTNAHLDSATGVLTWRPTMGQANSSNAFSVAVTDSGTPALRATNNYSITVQALVPFSVSTALSAGQLSLTVSANAGPDYAVLGSTNLTAWTTLFTTNPAGGSFTWTDPNPRTNAMQFYRVQALP